MNTLSFPLSNQLVVVMAPHAAMPMMVEMSARLALNGSVRVLDGGNRFNVYPVAQAVRRLTPRLEETLSHITLSRAFTCYQVVALLEQTPSRAVPTLVLDILSTFLDESVTLEESMRLLKVCIDHLTRLSRSAPVVVSAKPLLTLSAGRAPLVDALLESASRTVVLETPRPLPPAALPLWEQAAD